MVPSGPGHTQSWRVRTNLVVCPATGPLPNTGSGWLALETPGPLPSRKQRTLFSHGKGRNRRQFNQGFCVFWPRVVGLVANFPSHTGRNWAQGWKAEPAPSPGRLTPCGKLSLAASGVAGRVGACVHTPVFPRLQPALLFIPPGSRGAFHSSVHTNRGSHLSSTGLSHRTRLAAVRGPCANPS